MKHIVSIIIGLSFCALQAYAQTLPADTTFSTAFAFTTKAGDPTGVFLYKATEGTHPMAVFAYSDGGREIPVKCPRCGGTGYTWLNPKK